MIEIRLLSYFLAIAREQSKMCIRDRVMTWKSGHAGEHDRWNISNNFIFSEVSTQCLLEQLYPATVLR